VALSRELIFAMFTNHRKSTMFHNKSRKILLSTFIIATLASALAYAAYDYPTPTTPPGTSITSARANNIWIERDSVYFNNSDSQARLFIRFDKRVCGTPSSTDNNLAGLDLRSGTYETAQAMQNLAVAAKLAGKDLSVRTNDNSGSTYKGCHLSRLTLD
jgi:hypothetical protein